MRKCEETAQKVRYVDEDAAIDEDEKQWELLKSIVPGYVSAKKYIPSWEEQWLEERKAAKELINKLRAETVKGEVAEFEKEKPDEELEDEPKGFIGPLIAIEPEGINMVKKKGAWEEVKMYVDSGATETVLGIKMLESVETQEGGAAKRGVKYEVANGVRIPNKGEKTFKGVSTEGCERGIVAQVADVNKALLSVSRMVKFGHRVVFDAESYVEDKTTGEKMWLTEEGGMYALRLWVKEGF